MPLTATPQQKNAQSYNAIKNGLYSLNKFISANGSDDLFSLFTENKKTEIDDLFFNPAQQPNSNIILKSGAATDFLKITGGWFVSSNKGDPKNEIREKVFGLFNFNTQKMMGLRKELDKYKVQKNNEQAIINELEAFEKKIDKLTPDETFKYINLYISVRWDNILSLVRLKEIQNSLSAKKFTPLSPKNYELLKNKKTTENLASQDTSHDLSFSQLGNIKDWPKVKQGILNNLVPPQTDTLSSISTPSSSNTEINPSTSANYNANPVENSSASTDTSVSITPSIDTQIVINESAQNQETAQLKRTKKELEEKSQSLEAIKANLETQISELQILLQTNEAVQQQESESNKQKLENLQTTLAFFQKNTKDKEVELESLKKLKEDYLLSLQKAKSDLQKTQQEKNDLTTKLKETEVKIKTLEANNTKLADAIEKTNTQLTETANNLELKSSAHDLVSKQLNNLQTQHAFLRDTLGNHNKLLQEDLQSKETNTQLLHAEINKLNDEISLKVRELNDAIQKFDESKKTIDALKLNKIELEEKNNGLITQKNEIQTQLSQQKDTHQAFVRKHELLIAESTKKDRDLEEQKNVIIKVKGQLKAQIEQSGQLKEEIREKDKQTEEQRQKVSKINETLQEKEKEFQEIAGQLDTIKHQLREANEGEKTAFEKLAANELKMQEFGSLKEQINQAKENYNKLNIKLHSEENKTANLGQELNALNEEVSAFIQTVQSEVDKLNPQTHQEHDSIEAKSQIKSIYSIVPLDQDATDISIVSYDQTIEQLDHSKRQLFSTLYNLKTQDEQKKRLLEIKEKENDTLHNQYKDLEKTSNTLINDRTKKLTAENALLEERVTSLTNQLIQLEEQNKELYQATTPANYSLEDNWDSDNEETADDNELTAYQEELVSIRASLKETKTELEKKNNALARLQEKLFTQTEESNLNKTELAKAIDALKKSSEEAAQTISALKDEKEKLNKASMEIQEKSKQLENQNRQLEQQTIKHQQDIDQLTNDKFALSTRIGQLTDEKESLCQNLDIAQKKQKESEETISSLQIELDNLQTSKSTNKDKIYELTKRVEELSQIKSIQEIQIQALKEQINEKGGFIAVLKGEMELLHEKLETSSNQLKELEIAKNRIANQKLDLENTIKELNKTNTELQQKLNQSSVNDELVAELNNAISTYETKLITAENEIETLKEKLETSQKNDSNLRDNYASLDKKLSEKNSELNTIESELNESKKQLEEAKAKIESLNKKLDKINVAKQSLQEELDNFKKEQDAMKDGISLRPNNPMDQDSVFDLNTQNLKRPHSLVNSSAAQSGHSNTSSGHSSRSSSSSSPSFNPEEVDNSSDLFPHGQSSSLDEAFLEGSNGSISYPEPQIPETPSYLRQTRSASDLMNFFDDSLDASQPSTEEALESPIVPTITPINGTSMQRPEQQQDTRIESIFSNDEFRAQLKTALATKFDQNYKEVFQNPANLLDTPLKNALLNLDSEKLKSEALVNQTYARLLTHSDDMKVVLLSLSNASLEPLTLEAMAESLVEILANTLNPPVNPFEAKYCATLLQNALAENQTNAEKLIRHVKGVIDTFKEDNHPEISQAFTAEFERIASAAANTLFKASLVGSSDLPTFKEELKKEAHEDVQKLISALSNNKTLLLGIIKKIHTDGLNHATYLEEVKNSASGIFEPLTIKRQGEADQTYKDYIKDIGKDLLINLCVENLQTEEKTNLLQLTKRKLENKVTNANLQPTEHTETIKKAVEEMVTNLLKADKLKSIIEDAKNDPTARVNLLEASKQKLQEQLEQEVDQTFDHYFPIVHLNPIFQKIKDGEVLSEEEIQKIPSELQYADTIEDFVSGLRVKYSHLPSDYEGKVDDDNFKNLRLILRKKALADTNQVIPKDNEIIDLDAKAWLEKKLQLITGKSVNLELIKLEKKQEDLLKELSSSLQVSTFYDIAITRKTIPELTQEIEKANKAQSSAAQQISQIFKGIENKQTSYPKLIDDEAIAGFEANLNQHLENSSLALAVNNEQAKILLMGINQRLKKDISKWGFLDNKLQKEITSDIANTNGFPFDETATEKLVQHAMLVLRDNYPNETIEKRKQWLKDIALLHAITKKLALFSPKIKENIAKFEDLQVRKEEDINQLEEPVANKIADAVYLPHRHTIIANSLDPNLAKRLPADFELLDGAFYKQDPLQIGQTLTFALSLHNGEEQKCSVTRDETCLAYKIHTPWLNIVNKIKDGVANKMTYARSNTNSSKQFNTEEETLFTLLTHAVNSSKGPTHTIMLGKKCSNEKERFIRLFVEKFNAEQKLSSKKTILLANANDKLKIHSDDKKTIYNKIHKANSLTEELDNATTRTIDTLNRHITRPRG